MAAMREAFAATATDLLEADERVAIVLADISETLLARAIRHDPLRAVNVGIAEQTMVGVAAGFAMEGFHPIAHSLSPFMAERPYEQLKLDFGYQGLGGTFVGSGGSYDYAGEGATHHSPADASAHAARSRACRCWCRVTDGRWTTCFERWSRTASPPTCARAWRRTTNPTTSRPAGSR